MSDDYLPKNNADGLPIVPMTDVQKYIFDLKGWICLPGLIDADQCAKIREHLYAFVEDPEQLPEEIRTAQAGPAEMLLDHPEVVGVCNEIIAHMYVADEDYYGFRYDHDYVSIRSAGHDNYRPHGGGGLLNFV
ncbi:MAG: hypothetical protein HRT89_23290, partial [Lentisphaeria bacterium]|nr:hypothetical protein [Lentisphaeria bacterium]